MKKRTAFFGAILSLLPFGQPLIIKTGAVLSTTGFFLSVSEKVNAKTSDFYFDSAFEKANQGDHYGAISDYNKSIKLNQLSKNDLAAAYYNRGREKSFIKDYAGALSDFNKAINLNPNNADYYVFRGNTIGRLYNDEYGAISDYTKAIEIDPNNKIAFKNRGISKENIGDLQGACSDWEKASFLGDKDSFNWKNDQC